MLDLAIKYKTELEKLDNTLLDKPEYLFYTSGSYWCVSSKDFTSDWNTISRVSVSDGKISGFMSASIDRDSYDVSSLNLINFNLNSLNFSFIKDIEKFVDYLFVYKKFRKISFTVFIGNPAERFYDAMITKHGGRIVGTSLKDSKLSDGNFYDKKLYEIFRESYVDNRRLK